MSNMFERFRSSAPMANPEPAGPLELDSRGARWLRRRLAAGVVAITTQFRGSTRAATVSACTAVSIDPLQFLLSVELGSQLELWLDESRLFGLSVLSWKQQHLADRFAGLAPLAHASFRDIPHFTAVTGAPLIEGCIGWADCRIILDLETGDHRCFIGEALAIGRGSGEEEPPLVYFLNHYLAST